MFTIINNTIAWYNQIPELFLALVLLLQLLFILNVKNKEVSKHYSLNFIVFSQCTFILIIMLCLSFNCTYDYTYTNFIFINTIGTNTLKKIIIFFSILALPPIALGFDLQKLNLFEFYTLYLFSILSSLLLISAGDFLSVYLLIEIQSLCFYVLATFRRSSVFSIEAGIKYFLYGSIISCLFLITLSSLYGIFGTLNFISLNMLCYSWPLPFEFYGFCNLINLTVFMLCIVILFKLGIAPFHFWVPDVYEGSPVSSTIILSFLPKLVLFDLLIKISKIFGAAFSEIHFFFIATGVLTVLVGALFALIQLRIKRFFIYSSISQSGFPVIIYTINNDESFHIIYLFLLLYILSSVLTWCIYLFLYAYKDQDELNYSNETNHPIYFTDLLDLYYYEREISIYICIVFFLFAAIPPFSGFISKSFILLELISNKLICIPVLLSFIGAISTYYYIKLIKIAFFENKLLKKEYSLSMLCNVTNPLYIGSMYIAFFCVLLLFLSFLYIDSILLLSQYIHINNLF